MCRGRRFRPREHSAKIRRGIHVWNLLGCSGKAGDWAQEPRVVWAHCSSDFFLVRLLDQTTTPKNIPWLKKIWSAGRPVKLYESFSEGSFFACVVPVPGTGTGWHLVDIPLDWLFIRRTLDVISLTLYWITVPIRTVYTTQVRHHTVRALSICGVCFEETYDDVWVLPPNPVRWTYHLLLSWFLPYIYYITIMSQSFHLAGGNDWQHSGTTQTAVLGYEKWGRQPHDGEIRDAVDCVTSVCVQGVSTRRSRSLEQDTKSGLPQMPSGLSGRMWWRRARLGVCYQNRRKGQNHQILCWEHKGLEKKNWRSPKWTGGKVFEEVPCRCNEANLLKALQIWWRCESGGSEKIRTNDKKIWQG